MCSAAARAARASPRSTSPTRRTCGCCGSEDVDGYVVDARLTGRSARVVVASYPEAAYGPRELRGRASGWLPRSKLRDKRTGRSVRSRAVGCRSVRRPAVFSGAGVLTVYTVDLDKGLPAVDADAVFTSADTVYASQSSLYVATQRWDGTGSTSIHRFDTADPDRTAYARQRRGARHAAQPVRACRRRRACCARRPRSAPAPKRRAWSRRSTGARVTWCGAAGVGGLGRGERIYAVRFIGDAGYVVTFRETDPLYTLDLVRPRPPARAWAS